MDPITIAVVAAVLVAIVEVVKRTVNAWAIDPPNPDRYAPALTLVLGIAAGGLGLIDDGGWFAGLIAALTASGAYAGTKSTVRPGALTLHRDQSGHVDLSALAWALVVLVLIVVLVRLV